jgi:hypothetical protein
MKLTLGLYGIWLLLVAINGNAKLIAPALGSDVPGYVPWLVVAAVLGAGYDYPPTHSVSVLFLILVFVGYALRNYTVVQQQASSIYHSAVGSVPIASVG